ncbi:hypothetical protein C0J52_25277 [Blattella germanica]|nr:hypothetical protein C0J52_25277 [Blattella germanica]
MKDIDLDDPDAVWEKLTPEERRNFEDILQSGDVTRYFNGEHHDNPLEASSILMTLSGNLNLNHNYDSYAIAIEAVAHEVVNCDILGSTTESIRTMKDDAKCILDGPDDEHCEFYLQSFLSDVHKLLSEAKISQGKYRCEQEEKHPVNLQNDLVQIQS